MFDKEKYTMVTLKESCKDGIILYDISKYCVVQDIRISASCTLTLQSEYYVENTEH